MHSKTIYQHIIINSRRYIYWNNILFDKSSNSSKGNISGTTLPSISALDATINDDTYYWIIS